MVSQSALVILVPEAEALIGGLRDRHDPAARQGVPAHITLLYPFLAPEVIDDAVSAKLRQRFAEFAPISFHLAACRQLGPDLLCLMPEPDEPLRQLTLAIWRLFPGCPPYGGKWPEIVPHLTIANVDPAQLAGVTAEVANRVMPGLPITCRAKAVALLDNAAGIWHQRDSFPLSGA
jgi:2'-5' RNA ligase